VLDGTVAREHGYVPSLTHQGLQTVSYFNTGRSTTRPITRPTIVSHDPELRQDSSAGRDLYGRRDSRAEMREIPSNRSTGGLATPCRRR